MPDNLRALCGGLLAGLLVSFGLRTIGVMDNKELLVSLLLLAIVMVLAITCGGD